MPPMDNPWTHPVIHLSVIPRTAAIKMSLRILGATLTSATLTRRTTPWTKGWLQRPARG